MKKTLTGLSLLLLIALSLSAVSLAWLAGGNLLLFPTSFGGSAAPAYFASGEGTAEKPYKITNAVHLYNLAWLQYLGYFNRRDGFNNDLDQTYFELGADIDMKGRAIPPIGTEEYPFIGSFNGNGYSVKHLTVSNKKGLGDLVITPTNANFGNGLLRFVDDSKEIEILGMFGVTGNYNGYLDTYKTGHAAFAEANARVYNFYADRLHVRSNTEKTLIGLAAGFVGGGFYNVGIYHSDMTFAENAQAMDAFAGDEDVLSRYSLIGAYDDALVDWSDAPVSPGTSDDWGGSIDMKSLFTRLQGFKSDSSATCVDNSFNDISTSTRIRYYSKEKGSAYFTGGDFQLVRLYGGLITKGYKTKPYTGEDAQNGFYISSGGKYFTVNGLYATGAAAAGTDAAGAVTWYYDETTQALYTYSGGEKYYLNLNGSGVTNLSTAQIALWTRTENTFSTVVEVVYPNKVYTYTYYLSLSGTQWRGLTSPQTLTLTSSAGTRTCYAPTYVYKGNVTDTGGNTVERNFATYFPLITDENGNVLGKNNGYIASGSTTIEYNNTTGDIRLRRDNLGSALSGSLNGASSYTTGGTLTIRTRTADSNGFVSFTDTNGSATNGTALGLSRYESAKSALDPLLSDTTYIYGMHFMSAPISTDNIYKADYVMINNKPHTNYQMPANAIDFSVKTKGFITFFAGTYYNGSDKNFFSLHEVKRDAGGNITEIKEISKIYKSKTNSKENYVYLYDDGTASGTYSADTHDLAFDLAWITSPEMVMYSLYYFEIPVNPGEYALGSASTGDGAYLMYLDVGANGSGEVPPERPFTMEKVHFVNTDTVPTDANGDRYYPEYDAALVKLTVTANATGTPLAVFERDTASTDGKYLLAYRADYLTAAEVTKNNAYEKPGLTPSSDDD